MMNFRSKRETEEPTIQALKKERQVLHNEIVNLNTQQACLQNEVREGKAKISDLKDRVVCVLSILTFFLKFSHFHL